MDILLVEDDKYIARAMAQLINDSGCHRLAVVASVAAAQAWLEEHPVTDAVVADACLGAGGCGTELLAWVGQRYPMVRRVLITGCAARLEEMRSSGPCDWDATLLKPFGVEELEAVLEAT